MIELLKDIMVDLVLFSLIEGFIFTKFFQVIGGCKKFKWWEIGMLSLVNCVVSQTLPPLVYQLVVVLWMISFLYLKERNNLKHIIKIVLLSVIYTLLIEMSFAMMYNIFGIDFSKINECTSFVYMIPIRFVEISLLIIGGHKMNNGKIWFGDNIKRK